MEERRPKGEAAAIADALYVLHQNGFVPNYEKILEHVYRRMIRPGDCVFDVGAHSGLHLRNFVDLAGPSGEIHGFEPIPDLAGMLTQHYADRPWIKIHRMALGSAPGRAQFNYVRNLPEMSGLRERDYNGATAEVELIDVEISTLDTWADQGAPVAFLKIDIEGGEIDCLRGGVDRFFSRQRPLISVEYGRPSYSHYGNEKTTLLDLAEQLRYTICDVFGNPVGGREEWNFVCDRSAWDFFLVPDEKLADWKGTLFMPRPV